MKIVLIVAAVVVLLLAVNFAAFSSSLKKVSTLPLPILTASPQVKAEALIQVVVLSNSSCTLAGVAIDISDLKTGLVAAKASGKSSVSIKAAKGISYEALIPVFDIVRQSGIEQINIETGSP